MKTSTHTHHLNLHLKKSCLKTEKILKTLTCIITFHLNPKPMLSLSYKTVFYLRNDPEYKSIQFNTIDRKYNCDRMSHHGAYQFIRYKPELNVLVPCNPIGRTGLVGRGHLGRWGPNHAAGSFFLQILFLNTN